MVWLDIPRLDVLDPQKELLLEDHNVLQPHSVAISAWLWLG